MTKRAKSLKILQYQTRWKMIMVHFHPWSSSSNVEKCQTLENDRGPVQPVWKSVKYWKMIMVQFIQCGKVSNTVENDHGPVHRMWKMIMVQFIECGKVSNTVGDHGPIHPMWKRQRRWKIICS